MALQSNAELCSLMDLTQPTLFFDLSFQILIFHLLIFVCTQSPHRFFWSSSKSISLGITCLILRLQSILLTCPIKFNGFILTNERISQSPRNCINSLLHRFLQFSFTSIPPYLLFKTSLLKAASRSAISLFNVHDSAPYVAAALVNFLEGLLFYAQYWLALQ